MTKETGSYGMRNGRSDSERKVTDSSGNVFEDLGLDLSGEDLLKVAIARKITEIIVEAGHTQERVAKIIGTDQAKVSNLTRGRLAGFSIDRLMGYLFALGVDIRVQMSDHHEGRLGRLRVG